MWDVQHCDLVVAQVQNSEILETAQIFNLLNSVIAEVKHIEIGESIEVFNRFNEILTERI